MYRYRAYTLTLETPFPCPVLPSAPQDADPHVIVSYGRVPRMLAAPAAQGINWQAAPGCYLWRGGTQSGRFLVEGGRRVTLERNPAASDAMLAFHFLDIVLAALLRQRGMLVLHGNAAILRHQEDPSVVVISGLSGAGKSTTLAALLGRGCAMLADDITVLRLNRGGQVVVLPGIPQLHLTEEAAAALGEDISGLPRYPWRRDKAAVPAAAAMAITPAPLQAIYLLEIQEREKLSLETLNGSEKFAALQECIYGPMLPEEHPGLFPLFAAVAAQVAMYRLVRPSGAWTVDRVVDIILHGRSD